MEHLNDTLFLWINAPQHPSAPLFALAIVFAQYAIWLIPALVGWDWLRGSEPVRKALLEATLATLAALLINQLIALVWPHPRPAMIGLGHTLIAHAADSSFPSDHLTVIWTVAFSFLRHRCMRKAGTMLALLGLPVAWARIYLGVHFPMDMVGAAFVAALSAGLMVWVGPTVVPATYRLATRIHRSFFGPLIRRGWVRA
jgi:undecaprenyl-diphosphatase